jgi:hypothetical protein
MKLNMLRVELAACLDSCSAGSSADVHTNKVAEMSQNLAGTRDNLMMLEDCCPACRAWGI